MQKASHADSAVFQWSALQRPARAAMFKLIRVSSPLEQVRRSRCLLGGHPPVGRPGIRRVG
jgi:hypothetical protein